MAGQREKYHIVFKDDFEAAEGERDCENIGDIEVVKEEPIPPLSETDKMLRLTVPMAKGKLPDRLRNLAWEDLRRQAENLNPEGFIVIQEEVEEETAEVVRYRAKATVYKEKKSDI